MAEFQKVMEDRQRMCKKEICNRRPMGSKNNFARMSCKNFIQDYPVEAEQIIEDWANENPVITNGDKFKEVFGHELYAPCYASHDEYCECETSCRACPYYVYAEYHAPEGSEE